MELLSKNPDLSMEGEGRRWDMEFNPFKQGRRRLFESGTAIERRRRSPSAECTSGGEHERG